MIVYFLTLLSSKWEIVDSQLIQFISPERQNKIQKYLHTSDKKLCLYAGLIARMGLSTISGIPSNNLLFSYKNNHKPIFLSDTKYDFSIAHTRDFILCCISDNGPVGADVEKIRNAPLEIMDLMFHHDEIHYIKSAAPMQQSLNFYKIWTQKEAYTKMLGIGLANDLINCNTLHSDLSNLINTWQQDNYMCCVCGENSYNCIITEISENEIKRYFLETSSSL